MQEEIEIQHRRVGVIMLHGACSMSCLFCITENSLTEMTSEQVEEVLKIIEERDMESVVFGGGEPLQWTYSLVHSINLAKSLGLHTQVGTNGIGLTSNIIEKINADRYILPLDSVNPQVHNYLRGGFRKHYDIIRKRLKYLTERGISFTISTVICRVNIDILSEISAFLLHLWDKGARIHAWHLYRFLPLGRNGFKNANMLNISKNEYFDKTEEMKKRDLPFFVYRRPNMKLSKEVDFFWAEEGCIKIGSQVWFEKQSPDCLCK